MMKVFNCLMICLLGITLPAAGTVFAQQASVAPSNLQTVLGDAAQANKFTFVVFYRDDSDATRAMYQVAKAGGEARPTQAATVAVRADDPAEQDLVKQFGIARAPLPLTVVVAPNGVITGLFPRTLTDEQLDVALVPPTMLRCMKELQDQKLVFVCLTRTEQVQVPAAVLDLQQDPQFKDKITLIPLRVNDPAETRLYQQMKLDAEKVQGPYAVLIAPPGVLLGHYDQRATAAVIAAKIHEAGKCCDDPNCKHSQAPQATRPTPAKR